MGTNNKLLKKKEESGEFGLFEWSFCVLLVICFFFLFNNVVFRTKNFFF
jgi:hypothetical protein